MYSSKNRVYKHMYFEMPESKGNIHLKMYLTQSERRALLAACGDAALLLLEYYIRMASLKEKEEITDEKAANYFGWRPEKAKRIRQKLIKAGWFDQARITLHKGGRGIVYFIGQEPVSRHRSQEHRGE